MSKSKIKIRYKCYCKRTHANLASASICSWEIALMKAEYTCASCGEEFTSITKAASCCSLVSNDFPLRIQKIIGQAGGLFVVKFTNNSFGLSGKHEVKYVWATEQAARDFIRLTGAVTK